MIYIASNAKQMFLDTIPCVYISGAYIATYVLNILGMAFWGIYLQTIMMNNKFVNVIIIKNM